jgi:predicted aspartyl protease
MRLVLSAALVAAVLVPCNAIADGAAPTCALREVAILNMTLASFGRPTVTTSMEGKDVAMVVDTGGTYSMITRTTVDQLHLRPQNVDEHQFYMSVSGEAIKSMAFAHDFKMGRLVADKFAFLILPYGWENPNDGGTIAPDILARYDVEFDFSGGKMHLWSPEHCPGKVVYWTQQPYMALPFRLDASKQIHFTVTVDGKNMDALLDTGSSRSVMRQDMANAIAPPGSITCSQESGSCHYPFKSLSFGGVAVGNPDIEIIEDKMAGLREPGEMHDLVSNAPSLPLIVGTSILKKLRLYIAYKEGVLYATGADTH